MYERYVKAKKQKYFKDLIDLYDSDKNKLYNCHVRDTYNSVSAAASNHVIGGKDITIDVLTMSVDKNNEFSIKIEPLDALKDVHNNVWVSMFDKKRLLNF